MKSTPFVIEQVYNAPVQKVSKAITDKDQMKKWYFDLSAFKAEVGFEFQFEGGSPEKSYTHLCKVTEVIKGKKLSYTWSYKGYPGMSTLTFELFPEGSTTRLKLTHAGLETFPAQTNPDFAKNNFEAGWTEITITRGLIPVVNDNWFRPEAESKSRSANPSHAPSLKGARAHPQRHLWERFAKKHRFQRS